ncbi:MAG TPA: hypothetical protein VI796_02295, partial [Candidatus Thermoplasmatota archaeon]|nr:hypothetical protein [Candidatus Thermoplasmatota archaeon]
MALRSYERLAYRLFGGMASRSASQNAHLRLSLQKAHIPLRPEVYLSAVYLTTSIAAIATLVPVLVMLALAGAGVIGLSPRFLFLLVPGPLVVAVSVYLLASLLPDMRVATRARDIEAKLPYALNYITTMSSAGATPEAVFASLAQQP